MERPNIVPGVRQEPAERKSHNTPIRLSGGNMLASGSNRTDNEPQDSLSVMDCGKILDNPSVCSAAPQGNEVMPKVYIYT
jgi:hypothetical protein